MDQGSWILDLGPCSGMNDHPGGDTDVRSRPSESTIKDLSFYIGFTWIQSSKLVGPGFGMNGHSRRDPDTISRLPDTTIKDLSFYIGFIKIQSSIKHVGPCYVMNGHFWTGSGHEIKTIRIYYQRSIILYRFHKDTSK